MGDLALVGGRKDPQFHDRHHRAEQIVRGAAQPDAGGPEAAGLAGLAWGTAGGCAASQGAAGPLRFR